MSTFFISEEGSYLPINGHRAYYRKIHMFGERVNEPNYAAAENRGHPGYRNPATAPIRVNPVGVVYDKLFYEPGCYVRLPAGNIVMEFRTQIARPDLLQDDTLIDCLIQVYRIYRPIPIERLVIAENGSPDAGDQYHAMTQSISGILGIPFRPQPNIFEGETPDKSLRPGVSLVRLEVLFDPTRREDKIPEPGDYSSATTAREANNSVHFARNVGMY